MKTDNRNRSTITEPTPTPEETDARFAADIQLCPPHKCHCITRSDPNAGCDFWLGELAPGQAEYAGLTHCLHLRRRGQPIAFLFSKRGLEQLMIIANGAVNLQNQEWLEVMTRAARNRSGNPMAPDTNEIAKGFAEANKAEEEAARR